MCEDTLSSQATGMTTTLSLPFKLPHTKMTRLALLNPMVLACSSPLRSKAGGQFATKLTFGPRASARLTVYSDQKAPLVTGGK